MHNHGKDTVLILYLHLRLSLFKEFMVDICCIGHITLDKIVTPASVVYMPGGTSFYFSNAIANLDISYSLFTALAMNEAHIAAGLEERGITVNVMPSQNTVYFENIYDTDQNKRTQKVMQKADAFRITDLSDVQAGIFHLGPLLADDISVDLIKFLAHRGIVSLDVQGFLREVCDTRVLPTNWPEKLLALPYISILKANDEELHVLTGCANIRDGAKMLAQLGVKEVVITLGSKGSIIYANHVFYEVPAYPPTAVVDATGCGDTYMAGYLFQRAKNINFLDAGKFGAAMATIKIQASGPFTGSLHDVLEIIV